MRETADAEWRRLLRGAFAFQEAPFAVHPLDQRRAVKMRAIVRHMNVSKSDVIAEALNYLSNGTGIASASISAQLAAVELFLDADTFVHKSRCLWLVFWNSIGILDPAQLELVAAFDPRRSTTRIGDFLEEYYWSVRGSSRENLHYATRSGQRPYRTTSNHNGEENKATLTCGHNPWLEARPCKNIAAVIDSTGREFLTWQ